MNIDLINSFAVPVLILLFGWMFRSKLERICKTVKKVDERMGDYEKMRDGIEKRCPIYRHDVEGKT